MSPCPGLEAAHGERELRFVQPVAAVLGDPGRSPGHVDLVVVMTDGANLGFLESRLSGRLAQIPLRVVLADQNRLEERLLEAAATGQRLRMANRTYVAGSIRHPRAPVFQTCGP